MFLLVVCGSVTVLFGIRNYSKAAAYKRLMVKANATVEQHIAPLVRRRAQLVQVDPYGKLLVDEWSREIGYFVTHQICPLLSPAERVALKLHREAVVRLIAERSHSAEQTMPVFADFKRDMTPVDFEMFCAERLRNSGWDSRVTARSHDQGVDVIAEKNGMRVVLQCKLYSGAVGNKAVQEVAAGVAHENAHCGAVVSNSRYTSPAEQLARTNRILLLHYSELENLDLHIERLVPIRAIRSADAAGTSKD